MKWAWFSQSEKCTSNGVKGDQTGWESKVAEPYNFGQTRVIRAKDRRLAHAIARVQRYWCEGTSAGGYGQLDRLSLKSELDRVGIKNYKLVKDFNSDCSASTSAAVNVAFALLGIDKSINWSCVTWNIEDALLETGCFTSFNYTSNDKLLRGDIVLAPEHHVVVCISSGNKPTGTKEYEAKYTMNFRSGAGLNYTKIGRVPKGTVVKGYKYGKRWLYVYHNGEWGYVCRESKDGKKNYMVVK